MKNEGDFDCVEMMHQGAERVQRETEGMSVQEEVAYWRRYTEEMRLEQQEIREKRKAS